MDGIPIPDDWDGVSWDCVRIQWPNSPKYWGLLAGLLIQLGRGRYWDGDTGSIVDAQKVGFEIDERNLPFVPCTPLSPIPKPDKEYVTQFVYIGGDDDDCEDDMACCGYNPKAFGFDRSGNLYVKDTCGDWVKVGLVDGVGDGPIDPAPIVPPEENTIYTCGMANAVATVVMDLAAYIWDESDNTIPFLLVSQAEHHVNINLNDVWTFDAILQALVMKGTVVATGGVVVDLERSDVITTDLLDILTCNLEPIMGEDGTVSGADIVAAIREAIRGEFPFSQSGNNIFIQNYYDMIVYALGETDLHDVAVSGAYNPIVDCGCPEYVPPPTPSGVTSSGWYLSAERIRINIPVPHNDGGVFPYDEYGYAFDKWTAEHDVYGVVFEVDIAGGFTALKRSNDVPLDPVGTNDVWMTNNNSDSLAENTKYYQMAPTVYAELAGELGLSGVNLSDGGGKFSSVIASPTATKDQVVAMVCSIHEDASPTTAKFYVRWLHNVNSASHQ